MITTILLDLDDTLLGNPTRQFVERYFAALDGFLPAQISGPLLDAVRALMVRGEFGPTNAERFYAALDPALTIPRVEFDETVSAFYRDVFPDLRSVTTQRPAARRLVDALIARGYTVVVATNPFFPRQAVEQRLAWAGVPVDEVPFALVTHLENMHFTKNDVEYYEETLARVGAAASEAVMVGDDWHNDIVPASRAGLSTFWIGVPGAMPDRSGSLQPDGIGTLDDFARAALDEGWLDGLTPCPLKSQQIAPRLGGTLAALFGVIREQPHDDHPALLAGLADREQAARARLQAIARGQSVLPLPTLEPAQDVPDLRTAAMQFAVERQTTIEWLDGLDGAAWCEGLLREADALAADDRAIIARLSG